MLEGKAEAAVTQLTAVPLWTMPCCFLVELVVVVVLNVRAAVNSIYSLAHVLVLFY